MSQLTENSYRGIAGSLESPEGGPLTQVTRLGPLSFVVDSRTLHTPQHMSFPELRKSLRRSLDILGFPMLLTGDAGEDRHSCEINNVGDRMAPAPSEIEPGIKDPAVVGGENVESRTRDLG